MADDQRNAPRPFDVRTVEYLLQLMTQHDLAEIDLKEGEQRIRLRKGGAMIGYAAPALARAAAAPLSAVPAPIAATPAAPAPAAAAPAAPAAPAKNLIEIKSQMVGTFYSKPDPKKPDFVALGAKVTPKTVVCTIEAMKLYNEVTADCTGTVAEVCKKSGDFVEFGDVLFRVDPS